MGRRLRGERKRVKRERVGRRVRGEGKSEKREKERNGERNEIS